MQGEKTFFFKYSRFQCTKKIAQYIRFAEKSGDNHPKTFQKVNYVIFCTVFETVCASSLAMCAYQIGEHLHLTFADHLHLYSQQSNPNLRFPSEQIPLFF
jgi:hypothetical protein